MLCLSCAVWGHVALCCPTTSSLQLPHNVISPIAPQCHLSNCPTTSSLQLPRNVISPIAPQRHLSNCPTTSSLQLPHNVISPIAPQRHLSNCPTTSSLQLPHNVISPIAPQCHLSNCPTMSSLQRRFRLPADRIPFVICRSVSLICRTNDALTPRKFHFCDASHYVILVMHSPHVNFIFVTCPTMSYW